MITLQQQLDRTSRPSFGIGMHGAKRLPSCYRIADLTMQNNSNRRIDRIFLLLAPAAENHAGVANRFAVHRRNMPASRLLRRA